MEDLGQRFNAPGVRAVVLMGSHARGSAGPFSDVDLVRFLQNEDTALPDGGSHLVDSRLVVVSDVTPTEVERSFTRPEVAVETIAGLRSGRALVDEDGFFRGLQQRALSFEWDDAMQEKADRWASQQMVGWIEEVHKGLEGLRSHDTGRLLHARFGCSWGLARVMCVHRGILLSGDNALYDEVTADVGPNSTWTRLCRAAYGIEPERSSLQEQVRAGLELYRRTAVMLAEIILPEHQSLVTNTLTLIEDTLAMNDT